MYNIKNTHDTLGTILENKNILEGLTPVITDENENTPLIQFICKDAPDAYKMINDGKNVFQHVDFFGNSSFLYTLPQEIALEKFCLVGFFGYPIGEFELYASLDKEGIFNESSCCAHYAGNDKDTKWNACADFEITLDGRRAKYFALKVIHGCFRGDNIARITNITLINKQYTNEHKYIDLNYGYNYACNAKCFINSGIATKGDISSINDGIVFNQNKSVTLISEKQIELLYKLDKPTKLDKIVLFGNDISDDIEINIPNSNNPNILFDTLKNENETVLLLKEELCEKELIIIIKQNEVTLSEIALINSSYQFNVATKKIVNENFYGQGGNVLPMHLMEESIATGYNRQVFELEKQRLIKAHLTVARVWFQIDWITEKEQDYNNGIYNFDSCKFNQFCEYLSALKEAKTEVLLDFGWKIASPVSDWFSFSEHRQESAPKNLELYAKACAATIKELIIKRGYDNIKYLTMYNEPGSAGDFYNSYAKEGPFSINNARYWRKMADCISDELKAQGLSDLVEMWGTEQAGTDISGSYKGFEYIKEIERDGKSPLQVITHHRYDVTDDEFASESKVWDAVSKKPQVISEHAVRTGRTGWNNNYAEMFSNVANYGISGVLFWTAASSQCTAPLPYSFRGAITNTGFGKDAYFVEDGIKEAGYPFDILSIFSNFVPSHSKVLKVSGVVPGTRFSAFTTTNGDYTVIVELDHSMSQRDIEVRFDEEINKEFYLHMHKSKKSFIVNDTKNMNAVIPPCKENVFIENTLKYKADENYQVLCFTTIKPEPQVAINDINPRIKAGESVKLSAEVIDGAGEIEWSVCGENGSVSKDGVVKLNSDVKHNEMLAVKATLKNTNAYAVSVIQCD